jgi:hypothetical protein
LGTPKSDPLHFQTNFENLAFAVPAGLLSANAIPELCVMSRATWGFIAEETLHEEALHQAREPTLSSNKDLCQ